mmetsp:Transcript_9369/g.28568  ORF Transcript_9369/g.28568 Transcript_9369/m.28568 type:complete len:202 (-) Transcript_9369:244-849(-)
MITHSGPWSPHLVHSRQASLQPLCQPGRRPGHPLGSLCLVLMPTAPSSCLPPSPGQPCILRAMVTSSLTSSSIVAAKSSSTSSPVTASNAALCGGAKRLIATAGLLRKCRSRNTPIPRRCMAESAVRLPPPAPMMAAGLPAKQLGFLDAQSMPVLSTDDTLKLYSGLANRMQSAAAICALILRTGSGNAESSDFPSHRSSL